MTAVAVHLEGLGFTGAYLAWRLYEAGVPFTWEDAEVAVTAWRASTGSVYPSGHPLDMRCYREWAQAEQPEPVRAAVAVAPYWYSSKSPPHGGPWRPRRDLGCLRLHELPSIHVNVQAYVEATRATFSGQRGPAPLGARLVVAHGFGLRLDSVVWGWSRKVLLRYDEEAFGQRACFYCREGRYGLVYAYPVPGEGTWYAGSSMVHQAVAKELDAASRFQRWMQSFGRLTEGHIEVEVLAGIRQGWRPKPAKGDDAWVREEAGALHVKPQGASGVRHAPALARAVLEALGCSREGSQAR
ncbi:MAG TPA: hypothetical protein VH208_07570 [Myxococcaceae bacterium]|nr:hypothetical protein [Myxococcaceae bacterium]